MKRKRMKRSYLRSTPRHYDPYGPKFAGSTKPVQFDSPWVDQEAAINAALRKGRGLTVYLLNERGHYGICSTLQEGRLPKDHTIIYRTDTAPDILIEMFKSVEPSDTPIRAVKEDRWMETVLYSSRRIKISMFWTGDKAYFEKKDLLLSRVQRSIQYARDRAMYYYHLGTVHYLQPQTMESEDESR